MVNVSIKKLLHYGKCNDIFVSEDENGNQYALKRFYRQELECRKEYANISGRLQKKNWLDDFMKSLQIQLAINHDSCIKCIDIHGIDLKLDDPILQDEVELVLEYAECGCLMELNHFDIYIPVIPRQVVKTIAKDIFEALDYLSSLGIAHRDVKPDNIFMNKHGRCKLGDFSESEYTDGRGMVRGSKGTYYFYAPEMASSNAGNCTLYGTPKIAADEFNGTALDVWALGVTLWILYFRRFPFKNPSSALLKLFMEINTFDFEVEIKLLKREITDIEEDFLDLLKCMLQHDPSKRITPQAALKHVWLQNVNYALAKEYAATVIPSDFK